MLGLRSMRRSGFKAKIYKDAAEATAFIPSAQRYLPSRPARPEPMLAMPPLCLMMALTRLLYFGADGPFKKSRRDQCIEPCDDE